MGSISKIEWTDATWNPITGCSRVSEGCRHCYAERFAHRFSGPGQRYEGVTVLANGHPQWTGAIRFDEKKLLEPLRWKTPRHIFVNSMSDLFHENVTDEQRDRIFAVMALCPQHIFQVLTKRPAGMLPYLLTACGRIADRVIAMRRERGDNSPIVPLANVSPGAAWWPLANVWLGVSVEDQATADERIPLLLQTPAAVRFISAEPLLGPITFRPRCDSLADKIHAMAHGYASKPMELLGVDWVICGGESGPGARPMHPDWARGLRDQCAAAGVPFFFKQWGEWVPTNQATAEQRSLKVHAHGLLSVDGSFSECRGADRQDPEFGLYTRDLDGNDYAAAVYRVGKHKAGALLDGVEWRQMPEVRR